MSGSISDRSAQILKFLFKVWGACILVLVTATTQADPRPTPAITLDPDDSSGSSRYLFAPIRGFLSRLHWSPSMGWGNTWNQYTNYSGVPLQDGRDSIPDWMGMISLSWFDINPRPSTGVLGGPQLETLIGFYNFNQIRVARFRLAGQNGRGFNWNSYWATDILNTNTSSLATDFFPMGGFVQYVNGIYTRHIFGIDDFSDPTNRTLLEYYWNGYGWQWRDHGQPNQTSTTTRAVSMSHSNTVHNPSTNESWIFVKADGGNSGPDEVFARHFDSNHSGGIWQNLGKPGQNNPNIHVDYIGEPISVSYRSGGLTAIRVFCLVDHDGVAEIWERRYDGTQWNNWTNRGTLAGGVPATADFHKSAVAWVENQTRHVTIFMGEYHQFNGSYDLLIIDCTENNCTTSTVPIATVPTVGSPNRELFASESFVYNGSFRYLSHVGITTNGDILELYRDSRQSPNWESTTWQWRVLYQAPGNSNDFDGDGVWNSTELDLAARQPAQFGCLDIHDTDSDDDTLSDYDEINIHGTSPCTDDTDVDGMKDPIEVQTINFCLDPTVHDSLLDWDIDTLLNITEVGRGLRPCEPDSDADLIDDGIDNCPTIANGNQADLDGDQIGDVCDGDIDGDGCLNGNDPNPNDLQNPTRTCFVRLRTDLAVELNGLDPRLDDERLRDFIDGLTPRIPDEGGTNCPYCGPFQLMRFNEESGEQFPAFKLETYGIDKAEGDRYTAIQLPDLDGDGFADYAIGLPWATNREAVQGAGVVLFVSGDNGRELARFEGTFKDQGLGTALLHSNDGYVRAQSTEFNKAEDSEIIINLHTIGLENLDGYDDKSGPSG